ncbi:hypothetical protein [Peribacillus simplex]
MKIASRSQYEIKLQKNLKDAEDKRVKRNSLKKETVIDRKKS